MLVIQLGSGNKSDQLYFLGDLRSFPLPEQYDVTRLTDLASHITVPFLKRQNNLMSLQRR
jgi:hypothetical protein